jgi:hypothetical protein
MKHVRQPSVEFFRESLAEVFSPVENSFKMNFVAAIQRRNFPITSTPTFRVADLSTSTERLVSTSNPATRAAIRVGTFDFFDAAALWSW